MDITEASFYFFILISLLVYWLVPSKGRWIVLGLDSVVFCVLNCQNPGTFIFMFVSIASVYGATRFFAKHSGEKKNKPVLFFTLFLNIGILAVLKYTNLFINTRNFFAKDDIPTVSWVAPLAISFYTLTLVSYLLDCYWGVAKSEKNPLKLALYIFYFPLMVSGPIIRAKETQNRIFEEKTFNYEQTVCGMRRAAWGLLKKVVVADRLGMVVAHLFSNMDLYKGAWVWVACFTFVIELYFDFSGCMDIVIGISACFGIELPENFKAPFLSKTIQEFWTRWHITLGTWLKDYIMNPILKTDGMVKLGSKCKKKFGKSGKKIPSYLAMFFVWTAMGLWHGNSWKYIIGEGWWFWVILVLSQVMEPCFKKLKNKLNISEENKVFNAFRVARTFVLYSFGMLFFRASDLMTSFRMVGNIFSKTMLHDPLAKLYDEVWNNFGGITGAAVVAAVLILQILCDLKTYRGESMQTKVAALKAPARWILYFVLVFAIIEFGEFGQSAFIYFGF